MPCTLKGKPLQKVCLGLTFRDIFSGHCDIMVIYSQYMDSLFYLTNICHLFRYNQAHLVSNQLLEIINKSIFYQSIIQSSAYYDRIIWCHNVPTYVSEGLPQILHGTEATQRYHSRFSCVVKRVHSRSLFVNFLVVYHQVNRLKDPWPLSCQGILRLNIPFKYNSMLHLKFLFVKVYGAKGPIDLTKKERKNKE